MKKWRRLIDQFTTSKAVRRQRVTVSWYRQRLEHWAGFAAGRKLKPKKVKAKHLDKFFAGLSQAGYTANTIKGTETAVRAFFGWLVKRGKIKADPFANFERLAFSRQEQPAIRLDYAYRMIRTAEAAETIFGVRDSAIMRLLLSTGARREEVVRVRLAWIDLVAGMVKLKGKYSHERAIPLIPTTMTALRAWLEISPGQSEGPLFIGLHPNRKGIFNELRPSAVNEILARWHKRAGLPVGAPTNPHAWRRRFATELARAGDPFRLGYMMGHTDLSVTNQYVLKDPESLRGMLLRFAPGGGQ